jgi:hypothetical protein
MWGHNLLSKYKQYVQMYHYAMHPINSDYGQIPTVLHSQAHSRTHKKLLLHVTFIHMYQQGFHCKCGTEDFHFKPVLRMEIWLQLNKNNWHFTWRNKIYCCQWHRIATQELPLSKTVSDYSTFPLQCNLASVTFSKNITTGIFCHIFATTCAELVENN